MNSPRASIPTGLPLGVHSLPSPNNFEAALQFLISEFFQTLDQTSEPVVLEALQRLFVSLAHELGRVEGASRLHGVPREESLAMLRVCLIAGKRSTLSQHEKGCSCAAAKVLEAELESN